jgi:hypothetical protein
MKACFFSSCPLPIHYSFGKPKVGDFDVALVVNQQIFRLQISIE